MEMYEKVKSGLDMIFEPGSKRIIAAVVSVAYDDGTYDKRAFLPECHTDLQANLMGNLLTHCLHGLLCCYSNLSGAVVKLSSSLMDTDLKEAFIRLIEQSHEMKD